MKWDPFTLVVVLDKRGNAEGELYLDDGETYDYQNGAFIQRRFIFDKETNSLSSVDLTPVDAPKGKKAAYLQKMEKVRVEKVIIVGAPKEWRGRNEVEVSEEGAKDSRGRRKVRMNWTEGGSGKADWAVVRDPRVGIGRGWKIEFEG